MAGKNEKHWRGMVEQMSPPPAQGMPRGAMNSTVKADQKVATDHVRRHMGGGKRRAGY